MAELQKVEAVVVGAGIAGLLCALELGRSGLSVVVLETRPTVGGRMQTRNGVDIGAWRIPNTHKRMLRLAKTLNIPLTKTYSSVQSVRAKRDGPALPQTRPGMSIRDELHRESELVVDTVETELDTGYMGSLAGQRRTYSLSKKVKEFLVPVYGGMQMFCNRLAEAAKATGNVSIQCSSRVYRMTKEGQRYVINGATRSGNKVAKTQFSCRKLVLACQPFNYPSNNFNVQLDPVRHAIGTVPLCHVYVTVRTPNTLPPMHEIVDDRLGQIIAVSPTCLMVYCCGQLADFHNNSHTHHKTQYKRDLTGWLREYMPHVSITDIEVHYWQHAVSYWKPNASGNPLVEECIIPHLTALPRLICVGETFSSEQGWAEGALESAEIGLDYLLSGQAPFKMYKQPPSKCLVYDGRVIDVEQWMSRHPGGAAAIENHIGDKDVSLIFRSVHGHAPYALTHLLSLQIGFLR
jgi:glycine/D-amino acid oxidase-like deaminating enzyme